MRRNMLRLLCAAIIAAASTLPATPAPAQQATNINISFNGPSGQFTYMQQFWNATISYYQNVLGRNSMPGNRHCHVYLSWDLANQGVGSGPAGTEGSRAWWEAFLQAGNGTCDRILVSFKNIAGITVTSPNGYPTMAQYTPATNAFMDTDWSYAGWTKGNTAIDYTPWNEPNMASGDGDGYTNGTQVGAERLANYYLSLRAHCTASNCGQVAAGDFGSNGATAYLDFIQNCSNDEAATLCSNASYIDVFKHYLALDTTNYGFASTFRPEVWSFHEWNDINNYINSSNKCNDSKCTVKNFVNALQNDWSSATIWNTEVGAGQNPESNPSASLQACAAAWLLNLDSTVTTRISRIYYTRAYDSTGQYWSLYNSNGTTKASFTVLADRQTSYTGASCP